LLSRTFTSRDHPGAPPQSGSLELIDGSDAPRHAHWLVDSTVPVEQGKKAKDTLEDQPG
jgi:hypothetical protein